jgi:hypothetical protein
MGGKSDSPRPMLMLLPGVPKSGSPRTGGGSSVFSPAIEIEPWRGESDGGGGRSIDEDGWVAVPLPPLVFDDATTSWNSTRAAGSPPGLRPCGTRAGLGELARSRSRSAASSLPPAPVGCEDDGFCFCFRGILDPLATLDPRELGALVREFRGVGSDCEIIGLFFDCMSDASVFAALKSSLSASAKISLGVGAVLLDPGTVEEFFLLLDEDDTTFLYGLRCLLFFPDLEGVLDSCERCLVGFGES